MASLSKSPPLPSAPSIEAAPGGATGRTVAISVKEEMSGYSEEVMEKASVKKALLTDERNFSRALTGTFIKAGLHVVSSPSVEHDLNVSVVDQQVQGTGGSTTLTIESKSGVVAIVNMTWPTYSGATTDELFDYQAVILVNKAMRSPEFIAYAEKQGSSQAVAAGAPAGPGSVSQTTQPPSTLPPSPPSAATGSTLVAGAPQPNSYAVVVGIERYSAGLPPPTGARADAQRFADLAKRSLGLSPSHVHLVVDDQGTKGTLESEIEWLKSSVPPGGRIYFFFSGHGAPDASAGASYILPFDGNPKFLPQTALLLSDVLNRLGQSKAREVLAIVDSCFSGAGGRSVLPPGARPLVRVREVTPTAQVALFSASSGSEISGPASGGGGGLFTQTLTQGLGTGAADMDGDGQVSLQELADWTRPRVSREAKKDNREQTPSLAVGSGLGGASSFIVEWGLPAR